MNLNKMFLTAGLLFGGFTSSLFAQRCPDTRINDAFQIGLSRQPSQAECNANRYAGGAFNSTTELIPLVKASIVCSDPWIAQAYYQLGLRLNGHDPVQLENGRPGSTADQCNYSIYGSWSNYAQLKQLVQQKLSPVAPPTPGPTGALVTITGPATMKSGQPVTVTWNANGTPPSCGGGFRLQFSGGNFGTGYGMGPGIPSLQTQSFTFQLPDMSRSLTGDTPITINLLDLCKGVPASNAFATKIVMSGALIRVLVSGVEKQLNAVGPMLTGLGQLVDALGQVINDSTHHYYIGDGALKVADLVATGGGNLVATGGGNLVATGGGNLVAAGGGNVINPIVGGVVAMPGGIVYARAPGRTIAGWSPNGYLVDSYGIRVLQAGTGVSLKNGVMIDYQGAAIALNSGANIVQDAGVMKVITMDPSKLQQLLSGQLNLAQILNPGNINPGILNPGNINPGIISNIDPQRLLSPGNTGPTYTVQSTSNFAVSGFSARNARWASHNPNGFTWNFTGNPGSANVIVQMQLAGRSYDLCQATPVSARGCQIGSVDWSRAIKTSSPAQIVLIDGATRKPLGAGSITIQVP